MMNDYEKQMVIDGLACKAKELQETARCASLIGDDGKCLMVLMLRKANEFITVMRRLEEEWGL